MCTTKMINKVHVDGVCEQSERVGEHSPRYHRRVCLVKWKKTANFYDVSNYTRCTLYIIRTALIQEHRNRTAIPVLYGLYMSAYRWKMLRVFPSVTRFFNRPSWPVRRRCIKLCPIGFWKQTVLPRKIPVSMSWIRICTFHSWDIERNWYVFSRQHSSVYDMKEWSSEASSGFRAQTLAACCDIDRLTSRPYTRNVRNDKWSSTIERVFTPQTFAVCSLWRGVSDAKSVVPSEGHSCNNNCGAAHKITAVAERSWW